MAGVAVAGPVALRLPTGQWIRASCRLRALASTADLPELTSASRARPAGDASRSARSRMQRLADHADAPKPVVDARAASECSLDGLGAISRLGETRGVPTRSGRTGAGGLGDGRRAGGRDGPCRSGRGADLHGGASAAALARGVSDSGRSVRPGSSSSAANGMVQADEGCQRSQFVRASALLTLRPAIAPSAFAVERPSAAARTQSRFACLASDRVIARTNGPTHTGQASGARGYITTRIVASQPGRVEMRKPLAVGPVGMSVETSVRRGSDASRAVWMKRVRPGALGS